MGLCETMKFNVLFLVLVESTVVFSISYSFAPLKQALNFLFLHDAKGYEKLRYARIFFKSMLLVSCM